MTTHRALRVLERGPAQTLKAKDFRTDQAVRWCPGCGDYGILAQAQIAIAELGLQKEDVAVVSGIGCSSRFPYYMETYGFHTIHGRAPAFATGLKATRPELSVWVITGDGDGLSIGGNHLAHMVRRNVDLQVMLFNNRIYGLTKGQYSPTSEVGKKTKSTPLGSLDHPFDPLSFVLGSGGTFIARSADIFIKHLRGMLKESHHHTGTGFVEIYQNCNIFNDLAFDEVVNRKVRNDRCIFLEHGKPMVFGAKQERGIRLVGFRPQVIELNEETGLTAADCLVHDETDRILANILLSMHYPDFPVPMGIIHRAERPTYDQAFCDQLALAAELSPPGSLDELFREGDTWDVS